jgi:hypothetical protein
MDAQALAIEFTLQSPPSATVSVRLRRSGERWTAEVGGAVNAIGIAVSPRQALAAALEPLGPSVVRTLMTDLGLLEPSLRLTQLEAARSA